MLTAAHQGVHRTDPLDPGAGHEFSLSSLSRQVLIALVGDEPMTDAGDAREVRATNWRGSTAIFMVAFAASFLLVLYILLFD